MEEKDSFPSVKSMYEDADLAAYCLFNGNFINFGYWHSSVFRNKISHKRRLESQKNLYRHLLKKLDISTNDRLLEVGCGLGVGSELILKEFHPKEIVGLDFCEKHVSKANEIHEKSLSSALQFCVGDAEDFPKGLGFFDKIFSVEAAQHFPHLQQFIAQAYQNLNPRGKLGIATFFGTKPDSSKILKKSIPTVCGGIDRINYINDVVIFLKSAGFQDIVIESIGSNVWKGYDHWVGQGKWKTSWTRNWYKEYLSGNIDYFVIIAQKSGS